MALHVAEVLNLDVRDIKPQVGDTDSIGFTAFTAGSSATYKTGWACHEAAHDLLKQLKQRAALIWGVSEDDVDWSESQFIHTSDPGLRFTIKQLAARTGTTGGPVVGRAAGNWGGESPGFAVHIVDVEVDPETGKIQILRYTALQLSLIHI